jgi:hypothetical protein
MADRDMASRFTAGIPDPAILRIGKVARLDATFITVAISDSEALVNAAYLIGSYWPILGDTVAVVKQGNQWLVLGALSPNPEDNPVKNYSFEESGTGSMASDWTLYHDPGSSATTTVSVEFAPGGGIDGRQALRVELPAAVAGTITGSTDYISSAPIAVVPGQRWSASAWIMGYSPAAGPAVYGDASVLLTWYATPADTYPSYLSLDNVGIASIPNTPPWIPLRTLDFTGGVEVPAGATAMRVTLNSTMVHENVATDYEFDLFWDRVIAYQLG